MRFWTREDIGNEFRGGQVVHPGNVPHIVSVLKYGTMSSDYYFMDIELCDVNLDMYLNHEFTVLHNKSLTPHSDEANFGHYGECHKGGRIYSLEERNSP